jgi:hypothetical protein
MVPFLITEVAAYKDYLKDLNVRKITGQRGPIAFRFSMRENVPIYQYKFEIAEDWQPMEGRCIWSKDPVTKKLMIGNTEIYVKEMPTTYSKRDEVVPYIRKYIEHVSKSCTDVTSYAYQVQKPLLDYWKVIADTLEGPFGSSSSSCANPELTKEKVKLSYQF